MLEFLSQPVETNMVTWIVLWTTIGACVGFVSVSIGKMLR